MSLGLFNRTAPPALFTDKRGDKLTHIDPKGIDHAHGKANPRLGIATLYALDVALGKGDVRGKLPQEDTLAFALFTEKYAKLSSPAHTPVCAGNPDLRLDVGLTTAYTSYSFPTYRSIPFVEMSAFSGKALGGP